DAEPARRRLTAALDHAHRVLDRHLTGRRRSAREPDALRTAFHTAVRLGEVTSALVWEGRELPRCVSRVPLLMAARLLPEPGRGAASATAAGPAGSAHPEGVPCAGSG
ncbi:FUSC family protein, partial [Streptomyces sp. SID625]|nr:FUSC family protein [Streptomyces sp. SID625]